MAIAPPLNAKDLKLVPFSDQHFSDRYVSWLNDATVVRYSEQRHRKHTRDSCQAYVRSVQEGEDQLWAIEAGEKLEHIGNLSASYDKNNRRVDIGILIGESSARGKGYGYVAWHTALNYLCSLESIHKITGGCMAANTAMIRIMQRCNMKQTGCQNAVYLLNDKPVDLLYYSTPGKWLPPSNTRSDLL